MFKYRIKGTLEEFFMEYQVVPPARAGSKKRHGL